MTKLKKIDELMEKAGESLTRTAYFEAERLACKAMAMAMEERDFERMARIVLPLQESRRLRLQRALDGSKVKIVTGPIVEEMKVKRGCYLIQPPQVGADARRMRLIGLRDDVPVAVLCREPITRLGSCPIVAITPGYSVRTRIDPPANPERPSQAWFVEALEALGDAAIESVDPGMEVERRVEALLLRLDAVPDHEQLHQVLMETCQQAHRASIKPTAARAKTKS